MFQYARQFTKYFSSHIRFKIILPFALLTLMVAIIGIYLTTRLVADSLEERFTRQLVEAGQTVADGLAQRERLHLSALRAIAFTEGINESITTGQRDELQNLLFPLIVNYNVDRVDLVNASGQHLLEIHRPPGTNAVENYITTTGTRLSDPSIQANLAKVLNGVTDAQGDKYVSLGSIDQHEMLVTIGPVKRGNEVVGAILVSSYISDLLQPLSEAAFAEVNLYNLDGRLLGTTLHGSEDVSRALAMVPGEAQTLLTLDGSTSPHRSVSLGERNYDLLFGIFRAKDEPLGFYSVALSTSFMVSYGSNARNQMAAIFAVALLLVFGIGYMTANAITGQLQHLMRNAMAVAGGDFTRRTQISSGDEIGSLAHSLDEMTDSLARYTSALQHRIAELVALYESSTAVNVKSGLNLDNVLQAVTTSVKDVIQGVDGVTVHLWDEKGQTLVPEATTPANRQKYALVFPDTGALAEVLAGGKPRVVNLGDLAAYALDEPLPGEGLSEIVIAPLIAGQENIGMLTLLPAANQLDGRLLTEDNELLLGTLANQAAIAIKNAQLFQATQHAYEELRQLDDLKTQFINIAAHELRTPLGAMMGYASFVEKRVPPTLYEPMRFLVASTLRMRAMVDAMLTIQRLDAGTAFLRLAPVDLRDILKKALSDIQPVAELQGHVLQVHLPDQLPLVEADAEKIGLVLTNLLSNAIKFTPDHGQIEVAVRNNGQGVVVSVSDNGVGIAPEDQERIFERFYQARAEHIAGHGGMGLGLTIVKHVIELHRGRVWVESKTGEGSTFFFTLPQTAAAPADALTKNGAESMQDVEEVLLRAP